MMLVKTLHRSGIGNQTYPRRAMRVLLSMGSFLLILPSGSSFAQINHAQSIERNSSILPTVSMNQLLAPAKALRAVERAHKDIVAGHLESAQKEIARALDIAPHFALAKVMQGAIDVQNGKYEGATTLFQQAINDDPGLGGAYVGMAVVMIHQGRFEAALRLLDRAEALLPGAWFVHFAKASAQLQMGNTVAALNQAEYADRIAGSDSEKQSGVCYLRAMISIHMSDYLAAREHLAEAVARNPHGDYAALAKAELERLQPLLIAGR